ncbi:hypothetical protein C8J57DRAFT_1061389 [Mycena rebaudengoi]|nr:hypothetical protein C8J57DRAFT_1061389 [Mycena rebaudengoi]
MASDGARKRLREASELATEPNQLPPWECHPSYGVVHPSGCNTCRPYISHLSEARRSNSPSIQRALKDLDNQVDTYFFDGVAEGRRRQRADDQNHLRDLERYRIERNEALTTAARYRFESRETGQQLLIVQGQLRLAQCELDILKKRFESLSLENERSTNVEGAEGLEVEKMLLDTNETQNNTPAQVQISLPSLPTPATSTASLLTQPEDSSGSPFPAPLIPKSSTLASGIKEHPSAPLPARPSSDVVRSSGLVDLRATPVHSQNIFSYTGRAPQTLRQLQHLMHTAHQPGNDAAVTKVKMLCAEAHQVPREQKTELHRYILHNWRNPEPASSSRSATPPPPPPPPLLLPNQALLPPRANNPRMDDSVEVWHAYLTTHRGSWPRGVRREADGSPHLGDLKASRTVARLRPVIGEKGDTTARTEFMACAAQLLASPGMYRDLLRRNALDVAPTQSYKPYRATQFSITPVEVVRHFAASGVTVAEAVAELEPWAQEYQAAVVFPETAEPRPRPTKAYGSFSRTPSNGPKRHYDPDDRFGWR